MPDLEAKLRNSCELVKPDTLLPKHNYLTIQSTIQYMLPKYNGVASMGGISIQKGETGKKKGHGSSKFET